MNRATAIYLVMFAVLAVGLWGILRAGARLKAPADISGYWEVDREAPEPPGIGRGILIEQSGRYFRLHLDAGRALDMTLLQQDLIGEGESQQIRVRLGSEEYWFEAQGSLEQNFLQMTLRGRSERSFPTRRTHYGDGSPVPPPPETAPVTLDDPIPATQPDEGDADSQ